METFIIYAALMLGPYSTTIEFKQVSFTKVEECKTYLAENEKKIWSSLDEHISINYPMAQVIYVGCSPKSAFAEKLSV